MIAKTFGSVMLFFAACLLIWIAVKLLASIWIWLLILALIAGAATVLYRIHKNRPKW